MARIPTLKPQLRAINLRTVAPPQKVKDAYYDTPQHREWSAAVVARAGGACQECGRTGTRLFADHIVELQDGGKPDDLSNGQALCGSCHTRKTGLERRTRIGKAASWHPDWLQPATVPTTLVCGPPASGKNSYIAQHASRDDEVIDLDVIGAKLAGTTLHTWPKSVLDDALRLRNRRIAQLSYPSARRKWPAAWVIVSEPLAEKRAWWDRVLKPASIVVLLTPEDECWRRVGADPERAATRAEVSEAIARWWQRYTPYRRDQAIIWAA